MRRIRLRTRTRIALSLVLLALVVGPWAPAVLGEPRKDDAPKSRELHSTPIADTQQYCANIAAAAGAARNARQEKRLLEIEQQIERRLSELDAKRVQLQELLDRQDALVRKADESIVAIYARMRPDAAAAQFANMDEDQAAALLMQLQPKISSAILNEIDASRAVVLIKKISNMPTLARAGKTP